MGTFIDLTGQRFGRWTVIDKSHKNAVGRWYWKCKCDCGSEKSVAGFSLKSSTSQSCGCLKIDETKKRHTTHGCRRTREYRIWSNMKDRCNNPNNDGYKHYGGRGIKICAEWDNDFQAFLDDMGQCPTDQHSIERKDVNQGYTKSNCSWIPIKDQQKNTTRTRYLTFNGKTQTVDAWSKETSISAGRIHDRLFKGWSIEKILTTKTRKVGYLSKQQEKFNRHIRCLTRYHIRQGNIIKPEHCEYESCTETNIQAHHYAGYSHATIKMVKFYCRKHHNEIELASQ